MFQVRRIHEQPIITSEPGMGVGGVAMHRVNYMTGSRQRACFLLHGRTIKRSLLHKQAGGRDHRH